MMTDPWISAPSYTPHPESTTPIFFIINFPHQIKTEISFELKTHSTTP